MASKLPALSDPSAEALRRARAEAAGGRRPWRIADLAPVSDPAPSRLPRVAGAGLEGPRAADDAEFRARFRAAAPHLAGFDFEGCGLVLAGFTPLAFLVGPAVAPDDLGLFFVGGACPALEATLSLLARFLYAAWGGELEVYRTQHFVAFRDPAGGARVLLFLFHYPGVAALLYDFDLGGVAFDGRRVWLSAFGRLAAERGLLTPNWAAARECLSTRIALLHGRGFSILLPELDVGSCELHPSLGLRARRLGPGNCLFVEALSPPEAGLDAVAYGRPLALARQNLEALALNRPSRACAYARYAPGLELSSLPAALDPAALSELLDGGGEDAEAAKAALAAVLRCPPAGARESLRRAAAGSPKNPLPAMPEIPAELDNRGIPGGSLLSPREWYGPAFAEHSAGL